MGSYGPAGMIRAGMAFEARDRRLLAESYKKLNLALRVLRKEDFGAWMALIEPYLGDPADPSLPGIWRENIARLDRENAARKKQGKAPKTALVWTRMRLERHDRAIRKLAGYLQDHDLYVVWPKRMSSREEKQVERMNDEFYALYLRLRDEGMKNRQAIRTAAEMTSYSEPRGYKIVELRNGSSAAG